jgi:hypothetical protein
MRRFLDADGREWEVVVGRESWGAFVALFIAVEGEAAVRQTPLAASGYEAANAELGELDDEDLRELLDRSLPNVLGA